MKFQAVFLDFYGTLVHEDDEIISMICKEIQASARLNCTTREISDHWWFEFSSIFQNSSGESFQTQREIGVRSLTNTINKFESNCKAEILIEKQFAHWSKPRIYEDTLPFLNDIKDIPVYILSNIDRNDVVEATQYHGIQVTAIITSEDVKSYKPMPKMFIEALKRSQLQASEVIHIGDSLLSDVGGACSVGIPHIWLNRLNRRVPEENLPDYICHNLVEVKSILLD